MNAMKIESSFVLDHLKKLFENEDLSSVKVLKSPSREGIFFVSMDNWNTILALNNSSEKNGTEIECLTPPAYGIFQPNFEKAEEEHLNKNIDFFYVLNAIKEVYYDSNCTDEEDLYYDLLWSGETAIPVPVFLRLIEKEKEVESFDHLIQIFKERGVSVTTKLPEKKDWEYSLFPELTRKEVFNFLVHNGEQVEESVSKSGERVLCLLAKMPWRLISFFDQYVVPRWHIGEFNVTPLKPWKDGVVEPKEKKEPLPFLIDDNDNKYYLVRNLSLGEHYQTRIEKSGKLAAQEETGNYEGQNSFVFIVGKNFPNFKKWDANETVKIALSGYKIHGTDSEHRRYPIDNVEGGRWGIQYEEFPLNFVSTRKHHKEDEALVWKDSDFVRMCFLFPSLAKEREKALQLYKKFKWINEDERAKVFKNRFTLLEIIKKAISSSSEFEEVKISPFVRAGWYGYGNKIIAIKLGDFFELSGWAECWRKGERLPLTYSTSEMMAKTALTLALFGEKIE